MGNDPEPIVLNVQDDSFHVDQHVLYRTLLRDHPVCLVEYYDGRHIAMVNRYDDIRSILRDPRFSNETRKYIPPETMETLGIPSDVAEYLSSNMLALDPPEHSQLRRLVSAGFTPGRVARLRPRIQEFTDGLLDRIDRIEGDDPVDLIAEFAYPLPIAVICELLGIGESDRTHFRSWTETVVGGATGDERTNTAYRELTDYVMDLVRQRRARPGDDMVSTLVSLRDEQDRLTDAELVSTVLLLLVAGVETTVNLLGTGAYLLLSHPEQRRALQTDPARASAAVEEMLRHGPPVEVTIRHAICDVRIGDVDVAAGSPVLLNMAAANRDPEHFPRADAFDIERVREIHLSFGSGAHFCLGASLARLEGEIGITSLLRRFPELRLAATPDELDWRRAFMRGLLSLPVWMR